MQRIQRVRELNALRTIQNSQIDIYNKKKDELSLNEQYIEANVLKMAQDKFISTSPE